MVDWPGWVAMVMLFAHVICGPLALRLASRLLCTFTFHLSQLPVRGGMLPVPSAMLDGRKMSKHGASRRSAASVATLDNDDVLTIDTLPSVSYDPSVKEIESAIKDMKGTEDMPKHRHTVDKDGNPILLRPDGRKCRLCPRRDDQWDPVWLSKFRRHQQLHQRQQQQQPHQQPQPATTPKAMSSNSKNSNSIQS